jgi:hypothetical protein
VRNTTNPAFCAAILAILALVWLAAAPAIVSSVSVDLTHLFLPQVVADRQGNIIVAGKTLDFGRAAQLNVPGRL